MKKINKKINKNFIIVFFFTIFIILTFNILLAPNYNKNNFSCVSYNKKIINKEKIYETVDELKNYKKEIEDNDKIYVNHLKLFDTTTGSLYLTYRDNYDNDVTGITSLLDMYITDWSTKTPTETEITNANLTFLPFQNAVLNLRIDNYKFKQEFENQNKINGFYFKDMNKFCETQGIKDYILSYNNIENEINSLLYNDLQALIPIKKFDSFVTKINNLFNTTALTNMANYINNQYTLYKNYKNKNFFNKTSDDSTKDNLYNALTNNTLNKSIITSCFDNYNKDIESIKINTNQITKYYQEIYNNYKIYNLTDVLKDGYDAKLLVNYNSVIDTITKYQTADYIDILVKAFSDFDNVYDNMIDATKLKTKIKKEYDYYSKIKATLDNDSYNAYDAAYNKLNAESTPSFVDYKSYLDSMNNINITAQFKTFVKDYKDKNDVLKPIITIDRYNIINLYAKSANDIYDNKKNYQNAKDYIDACINALNYLNSEYTKKFDNDEINYTKDIINTNWDKMYKIDCFDRSIYETKSYGDFENAKNNLVLVTDLNNNIDEIYNKYKDYLTNEQSLTLKTNVELKEIIKNYSNIDSNINLKSIVDENLYSSFKEKLNSIITIVNSNNYAVKEIINSFSELKNSFENMLNDYDTIKKNIDDAHRNFTYAHGGVKYTDANGKQQVVNIIDDETNYTNYINKNEALSNYLKEALSNYLENVIDLKDLLNNYLIPYNEAYNKLDINRNALENEINRIKTDVKLNDWENISDSGSWNNYLYYLGELTTSTDKLQIANYYFQFEETYNNFSLDISKVKKIINDDRIFFNSFLPLKILDQTSLKSFNISIINIINQLNAPNVNARKVYNVYLTLRNKLKIDVKKYSNIINEINSLLPKSENYIFKNKNYILFWKDFQSLYNFNLNPSNQNLTTKEVIDLFNNCYKLLFSFEVDNNKLKVYQDAFLKTIDSSGVGYIDFNNFKIAFDNLFKEIKASADDYNKELKQIDQNKDNFDNILKLISDIKSKNQSQFKNMKEIVKNLKLDVSSVINVLKNVKFTVDLSNPTTPININNCPKELWDKYIKYFQFLFLLKQNPTGTTDITLPDLLNNLFLIKVDDTNEYIPSLKVTPTQVQTALVKFIDLNNQVSQYYKSQKNNYDLIIIIAAAVVSLLFIILILYIILVYVRHLKHKAELYNE